MAQQLADLPGGARLAPGESTLIRDRFMLSTVAFSLHTELVLTDRRLYSIRPNTLLGLIPVGTARTAYPIENIAGVSAGTRFDVLGVIFGAVGVLFGLGAMAIPGVAALGLLLTLVGLAVIIGAPKQAIEVMNSGGGVIRFPVSMFERGRTVDFANRVSEALAGTSRPRRSGSVSPAHTQSASTADALRHLQELRDQGLLTEAEYSDKRREILARI